MEKQIPLLAKLALLFFTFLLVSFFYQAVTTVPSEGDSLAYHIPIARSILDGSVTNPSDAGYALGFYPGSAEAMLAVLMLLSIPLNLYNVFGLLILLYICFRLARSYKLSVDMSIIFAVTSTTTLSMVRLLLNQTIDIWLAIFFCSTWLLLRTPRESIRYFIFLGTAVGLLIGSKFSAPGYAFFLFLLYGKPLLRFLSITRLIAFLVPCIVFGLSWYIRNIFLTGNPLYPQSVFSLPGNEQFVLMEWVGWQTVVSYPNGTVLMLFAFFSEYMLWILAPVLGFLYLVKNRKQTEVYRQIKTVYILGMLSLCFFFFLPSTGNNIITYLRYLFPAFIPLILCMFLIAKERNYLHYLLPLALMNSLLMLSFTPHQPKLYLLFFILGGVIIIKYDILSRYLEKR